MYLQYTSTVTGSQIFIFVDGNEWWNAEKMLVSIVWRRG